MHDAIVVFSRKGLFESRITARDVRSREDARKKWPLVAPDTLKMVTWVSPSFDVNGKLRQRSHFRLLPSTHRTYDLKAVFEAEEEQRQQSVNESHEHKHAKKLIAEELTRRMNGNLRMPWHFKDNEVSDFPFEGDLLLGASSIETEYTLPTVFESTYRLDIAILGPAVEREPMVLGGIEIELGHAFDGRKALIGRSLSFALISIDISEMSIEDITPDWAAHVLSNTTLDHVQGRRSTYIYLHNLLYPLYAQLPHFIDDKQRHQFLVFSDSATLQKLEEWIKKLAQSLGYINNEIVVSKLNDTSPQSRKTLHLEGKIAGADWEQYNQHQLLRITVPRPSGTDDLKSHRLHLTLSRLLLCKANALVGYKYCNGADNHHPEDDIWVDSHWNPDLKVRTEHRILPKRLAEPIRKVLEVVAGLR